MSTKSKKEESKAGEIFTRNKMKRKLRNTTKSMKRITQMTKLLRSPIRDEGDNELDPPVNNKKKKVKEKNSKKVSKEQSTKQNKNKNSKETAKRNETSKSERKAVDVEEKNENSKLEDYQLDNAPDLFVCKESMFLVKRADDEEFLPEKVKRRRRRKKLVASALDADLKPGGRSKPEVELIVMGPKRKIDAPQKEAVKTKRSKESEPEPGADSPDKDQPDENEDQAAVPGAEEERSEKQVTSDEEPEKESEPASPSSAVNRDLDSESLTSEGFMEILTCDSPVWWEDGPDEGYSEEPISFEEIMQNACRSMKAKTIKNEPEDTEIKKTTKHIEFPQVTKKKVFDHRFMTKRSKLESLLGNIKNKIRDEPDHAKNIDENEVEIKNNCDKIKLNDGNEKVIQDQSKNVTDDANKSDNIKKTANEINNTEKKSRRKSAVRKKNNISISESSDGENIVLSLPYEDALEFLDIPIESKADTVIIDDDSDDSEIAIIDNDSTVIDNTDIDKELSHGNNKVKQNDLETESNNERQLAKRPSQKLKIISIQEFSSPISIKSSSDTDSTLAYVEDTISDTNINFIDENSNGKNSTTEEIVTENLCDSKIITEVSAIENLRNKKNKKCVTEEMSTEDPKTTEKLNDNKKANDKKSTMLRLKQAYKELCSKNINTTLNINEKITIKNSVELNAKSAPNVEEPPKEILDNVAKVEPNCTNVNESYQSDESTKLDVMVAKTAKPESEMKTKIDCANQADLHTKTDQSVLTSKNDATYISSKSHSNEPHFTKSDGSAQTNKNDEALLYLGTKVNSDTIDQSPIKNAKASNGFESTYLDFVCKIQRPVEILQSVPIEMSETGKRKIFSFYRKRKANNGKKDIKNAKPTKKNPNGPIKILGIEILGKSLDDIGKKSDKQEILINKTKEAETSISNIEGCQEKSETIILSNEIIPIKSKQTQTTSEIDSLEKLAKGKKKIKNDNVQNVKSNVKEPIANKNKREKKTISNADKDSKEKTKIIQTSSNRIDSQETTKVIETKSNNQESDVIDIVKQKCSTCGNEKDNILCFTCDISAHKKSIEVSNSTVKYCMKCSSIFDTENCGYCLKKVNDEKSLL